VFRRATFFQGRPIRGEIKDLYWLDPSGAEMSDQDWSTGWAEAFGMLLVGDEIDETDAHGNPISGDSFLVLLNAAGNDVEFVLPAALARGRLTVVLDTARAAAADPPPGAYHLLAQSSAVIRVARRH
jgi:isoamylase